MARKLTNRSSVSRGTMPPARPNGSGAVRYGFQPQKSSATASISSAEKASAVGNITPAKKSASKKVRKK